MGYSDKSVNDFKLGFGVEIDMIFPGGSYEVFKYDRSNVLSVGV